MIVRTVADVYENFLRWLKEEIRFGRRRPGTLDYYQSVLKPFLAAHSSRSVADLIPYDLVGLRRTWHTVQAVQRLFAWAVDVGLMPDSPFRRVERPPLGERSRVLSRPELAQLLRGADRPTRRILLALRHTLARPGELRALRWSMYNPALPGFVLTDFKGKSRRKDGQRVRLILLDPWMQRMVQRWRRRRPQGYVFRSLRRRPWTTNSLRLAVRRARKAAGLTGGAEAIVPYTLRHTAATWATAAGVRDRALADLMGHATTRTTARYQHLQADHLAAAIRQATRRA